ncbi:MAG TPA: hypothetical protein VHK01_00845 [Lacipirellulaceae bacterium]|jgi:hypothetical protein|nr:hypothetical protein [Lacipirellulaceae bacterium]
MKCLANMAAILLMAAFLVAGCSKSKDNHPTATKTSGNARSSEAAAHSHGTGPNGGIVFDLGSHHAEFLVDHDKQQVTITALGDDEKTPMPIAATGFVLSINETKTADGKTVPPMTVDMQPVDATDGKTATFVGTDPGIANVADFAGTVSGEIDNKPAMGEFDEAAGAGAHGHAHTPHDGVVAVLNAEPGGNAGFVELKLHDDKGDLELWLGKDREMTQPLDITADTVINVSFKDHPGKTANLAVRNNEQNEDEDGKPNLRRGMTNYFIFPGDSGQDPTWLMGKDFRSAVEVTFTADGKTYRSEQFVLVPHTHAEGQGHTH